MLRFPGKGKAGERLFGRHDAARGKRHAEVFRHKDPEDLPLIAQAAGLHSGIQESGGLIADPLQSPPELAAEAFRRVSAARSVFFT